LRTRRNQHCGADSGRGFAISRAAYAYFPTLFEITQLEQAIQGEYLTKNDANNLPSLQHITSLRLREEFRRTAGGHTEADGKTVVCGACGDSWHFRDRVQLPEWLRQELTDRGL